MQLFLSIFNLIDKVKKKWPEGCPVPSQFIVIHAFSLTNIHAKTLHYYSGKISLNFHISLDMNYGKHKDSSAKVLCFTMNPVFTSLSSSNSLLYKITLLHKVFGGRDFVNLVQFFQKQIKKKKNEIKKSLDLPLSSEQCYQ